ncbi:hypothetical protein BH11BAC4_BH11BAC4_06970 [soil metagenome]
MMQSVFYIIPTAGIGGAEKRFIELCCYLWKNEPSFNFNLIISEQLFAAASSNKKLNEQLLFNQHKIKVYSISFNESVISFQQKLYSFVCEHTKSTDILHFVLSFPTYIFPLKHSNTVYSLTESSLDNVNIKGRLLYLLNVMRSKYADILDPVVHQKLCKYFFYKKKRILLTPGSFTDINLFKPTDDLKKENWFVFLGRFFFVKQVVELLKQIPAICEEIDAAGYSGYKFIFIGYGQQAQEMQDILRSEIYKDLPIEIKMSNEPEAILAKSKVFFSLQLHNNYPSKSLLEGLAAGNIALVTDVGTTRIIAKPEFSYYVPEHFSATDIATQLISILSLSEDSLQMKLRSARSFIENNFTIQASAKYYTGLYRKFQ